MKLPLESLRILIVWLSCLVMSIGAAYAEDHSKGEYRLGAGDSIRISVFQNPDLTVETRVSGSGMVSYPLIGTVELGGQTVNDAERAIANKLRNGGFVRQPQVNILVLEVKSNQVAVLGQVGKPGRYPIEMANTRVSDMLALAGGATPTGGDAVVLSGIRGGKSFRKEIAIPSLFGMDKSDADMTVSGGDILYVDRAPVFYIYGEVQHPGSFRLERGMTLLHGLAQGGGLTPRGTQRGMKLHRVAADGKVQVLDPKMDMRLQPDDVIYIPESLF